MSVIVEKPYQFVPPHRGDGWPTWIQRLRLVDRYLQRKEGIVDCEVRNVDVVRNSLVNGDAVLLAPNHCRYADPLVLGWPARQLKRHVFAVASWHLFNKNWFESFAIQKMGGFSLFREGTDRQSLQTAIDILYRAERPLILFPEGTTNRSNDHLQPLLDGVSFLARTAAKRRAKDQLGRVVIHPVGIKYVFQGEIIPWADQALEKLERQIKWRFVPKTPLLPRIRRLADALLTLQEIHYLGATQSGPLYQRRVKLTEALLGPLEQHHGVTRPKDAAAHRVRELRSLLLPKLLAADSPGQKESLRAELHRVELARKLDSYVEGYLREAPVTDTRILETVQRMQEDFLGSVDSSTPLKVIIHFDDPIVVPTDRPPRGQRDPLMEQLELRLKALLSLLQHEARLFYE